MRRNPNPIAERLDYLLVSVPLHNMIESIDPGFRSDHSIPWLTLTKNESLWGSGFWK